MTRTHEQLMADFERRCADLWIDPDRTATPVIDWERATIPCEVYSRVVGYLRPVQSWNIGKRQEYGERIAFSPEVRDGRD